MNNFRWKSDQYLNNNVNTDKTIAETFILGISGHERSELQVQSCLNSCTRVGQPNVSIFWGYDGTDHISIKTPEHLRTNSVMSWIRVLDPRLSITEVACALSHIALWVHCIDINRPIVVLEHDSIMLQPFLDMYESNCIEYLGHRYEIDRLIEYSGVSSYERLVKLYIEQPQCRPVREHNLPMVGLINRNYLYSMGLHAYAIDPFISRRLVARILTDGLVNPIDTLIEVSDFSLIQTGIFAFNSDSSYVSSIGQYDGTVMAGRKHTLSVPGIAE